MNRTSWGAQRLRAAAAIVCSTVAVLSAAPSWSSHVGESLSLDQQLIGANNQLLAALAQWQKAPPALRASGIAQLTQLAQHRQEHLILLLQQNPGVAAARMMPRSLRAKLPAQAAAYVEEEVRVQGTAIAHVSDDFANGRSRSVFKLHGDEGTVPLNVYLADATRQRARPARDVGQARGVLDAMRIGEHLLILDRRKVQLEAAGSTELGRHAGRRRRRRPGQPEHPVDPGQLLRPLAGVLRRRRRGAPVRRRGRDGQQQLPRVVARPGELFRPRDRPVHHQLHELGQLRLLRVGERRQRGGEGRRLRPRASTSASTT